MKGLLFLLCCTEILCALLSGAQTIDGTPAAATPASLNESTEDVSTGPTSPSSSATSLTTDASTKSEAPPPPSKVTQDSGYNPSPVPPSIHPIIACLNNEECLPVLMVAGALILVCVLLLVCTLLLMCRVCQLNRRIKMLSSDSDLISTSKYWVGNAKKDKNKAEAEAKETTVLMSDICQAQEETDKGATKEEGEKVKEDGQTAEENKKEGGDAPKSEDAAATPAENAPQEEASDSPCAEPVAAPSPQGAEEPKDVV